MRGGGWNGDPHSPELDKFKFQLDGDGDFASQECIEFLKEADIVVTNPPFSLFRKYLAQLVEYKKKFIILGNQTQISAKKVFPLFHHHKVWLGPSIRAGDRWFGVPDHYDLLTKNSKVVDGKKMVKVPSVRWFTNLDHKPRHEMLGVASSYNKEDYPMYDNFAAIRVNGTRKIPGDYAGTMAVPISFMNYYNPDQFKILGITDGDKENPFRTRRYTKDDTPRYSSLNGRAALRLPDGSLKKDFPMILIRNRNPRKPS